MKNWAATNHKELLFSDIFLCCFKAGFTFMEGIAENNEVMNIPVTIIRIVIA